MGCSSAWLCRCSEVAHGVGEPGRRTRVKQEGLPDVVSSLLAPSQNGGHLGKALILSPSAEAGGSSVLPAAQG